MPRLHRKLLISGWMLVFAPGAAFAQAQQLQPTIPGLIEAMQGTTANGVQVAPQPAAPARQANRLSGDRQSLRSDRNRFNGSNSAPVSAPIATLPVTAGVAAAVNPATGLTMGQNLSSGVTVPEGMVLVPVSMLQLPTAANTAQTQPAYPMQMPVATVSPPVVLQPVNVQPTQPVAVQTGGADAAAVPPEALIAQPAAVAETPVLAAQAEEASGDGATNASAEDGAQESESAAVNSAGDGRAVPSYGNIDISVLFAPSEIENMRRALDIYETRPKNSGMDNAKTMDDLFGELEKESAGEAAPAPLPVFHLSSIIYRGGNDWAAWMNGQRYSPRTKTNGEITLVGIARDRATFQWKPANFVQLYRAWEQRSKMSRHFRSARTQPMNLDIDNRLVQFTLQPNQVFAVDQMQILEGSVVSSAGIPAAASSVAPAALATPAQDPTLPAPASAEGSQPASAPAATSVNTEYNRNASYSSMLEDLKAADEATSNAKAVEKTGN